MEESWEIESEYYYKKQWDKLIKRNGQGKS